MSELATKLLKLIPADAKLIVEIGDLPGLAENFGSINPFATYLSINLDRFNLDQCSQESSSKQQNELNQIAANSVDCLVFSDFAKDSSTLSDYLPLLKPDGLIVGYCSNLHYWQALAQYLAGNAIAPSLSLKQLRHILGGTAENPLSLFDLQLDSESNQNSVQKSDQNSAAKEFIEFAQPLLQHLRMPIEQILPLLNCRGFLLRASKTKLSQRQLLIHTFISAPIGCDRVRVLEPDHFSASHPGNRIVQVRVGEGISLNVANDDEEKVLIWQRALLRYPDDIQKQKLLIKNGYLIVAEHDDDPYFWPENADHKYLLFWSSHCVQTSTPTLAKHLSQWNPNVTVFANQLSYLPERRNYSKKSQVSLFFGALNRQTDWEPLMPILNRILRKFQQVQVQVIHDRAFFEALETKHKQFTPWCAYEQYQQILHNCDIGILPLNDNQFNRMKSDLKFLEHAAHGTVALASPVVYQDSIIEGETGMIYNSLPEFEAKLVKLIRDSNLRQKIAENAYNWARENRLMSQHFQQRREWYLEMRSQLPRLNAELRDRCPQIFE
jgi:glycosyltransferase involved in cell wall biosynthesis